MFVRSVCGLRQNIDNFEIQLFFVVFLVWHETLGTSQEVTLNTITGLVAQTSIALIFISVLFFFFFWHKMILLFICRVNVIIVLISD